MKEFFGEFSQNPVFETVVGLTNTEFDSNSYEEDRMATEAQIKQVATRLNELEQRVDLCCRDIVLWRSYVRVVMEGSALVVSDWIDNMTLGTARRGKKFTVEFALPHDSAVYYDNKSEPRGTNSYYDRMLKVCATSPGNSQRMQQCFYDKAIGQYDDGNWTRPGTSNNADSFCKYTWVSNLDACGIPAIAVPGSLDPSNYALPYSNNEGGLSGAYYVYKDTDNKIKVDVNFQGQYQDNDYIALFFTQFVQRA